jgi:hypothetical protein
LLQQVTERLLVISKLHQVAIEHLEAVIANRCYIANGLFAGTIGQIVGILD